MNKMEFQEARQEKKIVKTTKQKKKKRQIIFKGTKAKLEPSSLVQQKPKESGISSQGWRKTNANLEAYTPWTYSSKMKAKTWEKRESCISFSQYVSG